MKISEDQLLARVKHLPALPQAVLELNEAMRGEDVQADRIVRIVSRDPALTIAALRLANSSFYGVSGRIATLRDAVQILGLNSLVAVMMTAAVRAVFDGATCPGFDFDGEWRHAIATAVGAQMLAQSRGLDPCEAYTVGLLHDVGRLALAAHFPQQVSEAMAWGVANDAAPIDAEREVIGIDHALAGHAIATHWRLAPHVVEAIGQHHETPPDAGCNLLDVLHLADTITHALDLSRAPDERVPPLALGTWERMELSGEELQRVFESIESRMQACDFGVAATA